MSGFGTFLFRARISLKSWCEPFPWRLLGGLHQCLPLLDDERTRHARSA